MIARTFFGFAPNCDPFSPAKAKAPFCGALIYNSGLLATGGLALLIFYLIYWGFGKVFYCRLTYDGLHAAGATLPFISVDLYLLTMSPSISQSEYTCAAAANPQCTETSIKHLPTLLLAYGSYCQRHILGTNGVVIPHGDWLKHLSSVRICLHGYCEADFNNGSPDYTAEAWQNIWKYFESGIGEVWVTVTYDHNNYLQIFSLVERMWKERERLCGEHPALRKKELGIKIMAIADDAVPENPFHLSDPSFDMNGEWSEKHHALLCSGSPFGEYLKKVSNGFIDTGFMLPQEILAGRLFAHNVSPVRHCWPVTNYILISADGHLYPCPAAAAQKRDTLGTMDSDAKDILSKRRDLFHCPCHDSHKGCRMLTTFMSTPIVDALKRGGSKTVTE
jgi:hypothetical protein